MTAALVGTVGIQVRGKAAGPVSALAGRVGIRVASHGVLAPPVAHLTGRVGIQVKARASETLRGALTGRVGVQVKGHATFSGVAPVIDFAVETLMRSTPVPAIGHMDADDVVCQGSFVL